MSDLHLPAQVLEDGSIRLPAGVHLTPGAIEITIVGGLETTPSPAGQKHLFEELAELGRQYDTSTAPTDLAENHDHYLHKLAKGIDSE